MDIGKLSLLFDLRLPFTFPYLKGFPQYLGGLLTEGLGRYSSFSILVVIITSDLVLCR